MERNRRDEKTEANSSKTLQQVIIGLIQSGKINLTLGIAVMLSILSITVLGIVGIASSPAACIVIILVLYVLYEKIE